MEVRSSEIKLEAMLTGHMEDGIELSSIYLISCKQTNIIKSENLAVDKVDAGASHNRITNDCVEHSSTIVKQKIPQKQ